jgi:hypothetical protein
MWSPGTEVFYKCSECGQTFKMFGNKELFCHNCGLKQDWSDSPQHCSKEFKDKYDNLVYEQSANVRGDRPQDVQLLELLRNFYFGTQR